MHITKTSDEILCSVIGKANLLRQWASELTTFQKYTIQEASDTLQDVIGEVEGEENEDPHPAGPDAKNGPTKR